MKRWILRSLFLALDSYVLLRWNNHEYQTHAVGQGYEVSADVVNPAFK